jgi:hypothetical protein
MAMMIWGQRGAPPNKGLPVVTVDADYSCRVRRAILGA